jgi:hypothetical protein
MRFFASAAAIAVSVAGFASAAVAAGQFTTRDVLLRWYNLSLELTRHTATYTPPVASRAFAYVGVTAYEALASGSDALQSLAGQLNELTPVPAREAGAVYDDTIVLDSALSTALNELYVNTGPTGHRTIDALGRLLGDSIAEGVEPDVVDRSKAYGAAVAAHILAWAATDGGAKVVNMGFPMEYTLSSEPGHWVPTSTIVQQQAPLLPEWGENRPFAMPENTSCAIPAPMAYSEEKDSPFYLQAKEVFDAKAGLTPEQTAIARFWADDAMLTVTPPGHWISIVIQLIQRDDMSLDKSLDILTRLAVAEADAFIGCWQAKFQYDTIRPITYIRKLMDPAWETLVNTPPFPEYPSGHSTQSAAAAEVLTAILGDNFAFEDATGAADNLQPRKFPSFWAAANEAAISRLYGGIHFREAIDNGQDQGRCIGAYALALKTWR